MKKIILFLMRLLGLEGREKLQLKRVPDIDYGMLETRQQIAMDSILTACANGAEVAEIPAMSQEEFDAVVDHIGMYFGNSTLCQNIALKRGNLVQINADLAVHAEAHKRKLDAVVEQALGQMYAGSREDVLRQIAGWIASHATYRYGSNDPLDLVEEGGMCGAYAMLFYKMATRLGLQCYICYGYASNGIFTGAHAWNKVQLEDDARFYDITFYDGAARSRKWLNSADGWGRCCSINSKAALRRG